MCVPAREYEQCHVTLPGAACVVVGGVGGGVVECGLVCVVVGVGTLLGPEGTTGAFASVVPVMGAVGVGVWWFSCGTAC